MRVRGSCARACVDTRACVLRPLDARQHSNTYKSHCSLLLIASCPLHVAHQSRSANGNLRDLRHYSVSGNGRFRSGTDDALLLWPARSGRPRRKAYDNTHTVGLTFGSSVSSSPLLARLGRSEGKEQFCGHRKNKKQMQKCGIYFFTEKIEIEVITEDKIKRSDHV